MKIDTLGLDDLVRDEANKERHLTGRPDVQGRGC